MLKPRLARRDESAHKGRVRVPSRKAAAPDFEQVCALWDRGHLAAAHRAFLVFAHQGDVSSQLNVGYMYDQGLGTRRSKAKALDWYRRAYAGGSASGAHNIGTVFRDRRRESRAIWWFRRSIKMGNVSSGIELAKIFFRRGTNTNEALALLKAVIAGDSESEGDEEEARILLAAAPSVNRWGR